LKLTDKDLYSYLAWLRTGAAPLEPHEIDFIDEIGERPAKGYKLTDEEREHADAIAVMAQDMDHPYGAGHIRKPFTYDKWVEDERSPS